MFRIPRTRPWPPTLDLSTVRETLTYMRDDMRRVPGLEQVAEAIDAAMIEIEVAERSRRPTINGDRRLTARFLPWTPGTNPGNDRGAK